MKSLCLEKVFIKFRFFLHQACVYGLRWHVHDFLNLELHRLSLVLSAVAGILLVDSGHKGLDLSAGNHELVEVLGADAEMQRLGALSLQVALFEARALPSESQFDNVSWGIRVGSALFKDPFHVAASESYDLSGCLETRVGGDLHFVFASEFVH